MNLLDYADRILAATGTDQEVADALNVVTTTYRETWFSFRTLQKWLGADRTAEIRLALISLSTNAALTAVQQQKVKDVLEYLAGTGYDIAEPETRAQFAVFAALGVITADEMALIESKGVASVSQPPGITVQQVAWVRANYAAYQSLIAALQNRWNKQFNEVLPGIVSGLIAVPTMGELDEDAE